MAAQGFAAERLLDRRGTARRLRHGHRIPVGGAGIRDRLRRRRPARCGRLTGDVAGALLDLTCGEKLPVAITRWEARYIPAYIRR
jgi:hypothetical protein